MIPLLRSPVCFFFHPPSSSSSSFILISIWGQKKKPNSLRFVRESPDHRQRVVRTVVRVRRGDGGGTRPAENRRRRRERCDRILGRRRERGGRWPGVGDDGIVRAPPSPPPRAGGAGRHIRRDRFTQTDRFDRVESGRSRSYSLLRTRTPR